MLLFRENRFLLHRGEKAPSGGQFHAPYAKKSSDFSEPHRFQRLFTFSGIMSCSERRFQATASQRVPGLP